MFHFTSKLIHFVYFSHSPVAKDEKVEGRRLKAPKEEFERMCISVSGFYSCHDQQHRPGRKQPWLSDGPFSLCPGAVFPLCLRCRGSLPGLTRVMVRPYHFGLLNVSVSKCNRILRPWGFRTQIWVGVCCGGHSSVCKRERKPGES